MYGLSSDKLGGIETFLLNMNQFMSDEMVFDYVMEGSSTIHQEAVSKKGGKVFFIAPKRNMLRNIADWAKLLKAYRKTSDVVYFNMFSLAWSVPVYMTKLYGYRVIVHAHNNNLHDCGAVLKALHAANRFLLQHVDIVRFTNSDLSEKFFFGKKPAEMIYNAIDTERFAFHADVRDRIRGVLGVQDKHVYGFSGRIAYQKNPLFLMDIFGEIAKLDQDAAFIVCGDGDLMEQTKQKTEDLGIHVRFLGNVWNVQDYYQAMDCFILPSRFEGLGIVLIEAQCAGLPCITSAEVVPKDVQVTDLVQFIRLADNPEQWAQTAVGCMQARGDKHQYQQTICHSGFNIETEALRLELLLKEVVQ